MMQLSGFYHPRCIWRQLLLQVPARDCVEQFSAFDLNKPPYAGFGMVIRQQRFRDCLFSENRCAIVG